MHSHDFKIRADDGLELAATLHEPIAPQPQRPVAVIASATAVPRRYYAKFADFLAEQGHPTVTFDYRGIGQSKPASLVGFQARMRDWGIRDIPAVLDHVAATMPGRPIHWVGHSYGGFGTGLAHNNHRIARQLSVSSMSAYLGLLPSATHLRLSFLMGGPMRALAHGLGYFPGRLLGGEDLPKGVALEWSRWCRSREFLFGDESLAEKAHFDRFLAPIRFAFMADDPWVVLKGVEELASRFTNARQTSVWRIGPAETGGAKGGHLGFFRSEFRHSLWPKAYAWLMPHKEAV
jgi:predicted alpha/beta hydrolase